MASKFPPRDDNDVAIHPDCPPTKDTFIGPLQNFRGARAHRQPPPQQISTKKPSPWEKVLKKIAPLAVKKRFLAFRQKLPQAPLVFT